ncbi:hypothetical protein WJX82_005786 [Trebouxia sp. C0006]
MHSNRQQPEWQQAYADWTGLPATEKKRRADLMAAIPVHTGVLESALDLERPAYYDNFITSELLELLHDVSERIRNMGNYAQNVCYVLS